MKKQITPLGKCMAIGLLALSVTGAIHAQTKTVIINKTKKFQKIDGFGSYGLNEVAWGSAPYYDANFVKTMVDDMGLTISRAEGYPMEATNDNNDPLVADMTKFKPSPFNQAYYTFAKEAQALANSKGDTIKFFYSVWSPPAWMKYVNSEFGTDGTWNRLIAKDFTPDDWMTFDPTRKPAANPDDYKDEFAEHCWVHSKLFKEKTGFELYAFSLQNELAFAQTYNSCVYSPNQYRELLKVAGNRFRNVEKSKIKFLMHEDIGDLGRYRQFMDAVTKDAEAIKYQDIAACHAYNATGTLAGSTSASTWDGMYRVSNAKKPTPFWQTETSGYGLGWTGGMSLAKAIYVGLKFGKVSAWVWWQTGEKDSGDSEYALIRANVKSKKYFTMKHFARYIRPNAVGVEATCAEDVDILPLAFQHDTKKTLTVVLINQSNAEKTVKLSFADPSITPTSYKMYISNETNDCADKGSVNAGADIKIPANTLMTLMGEGSMPIITGTESVENETSSFTVHPNPASSIAVVEYKTNMSTIVEIKDAYARVIKSIPTVFTSNNYSTEINTEDLPNGVYFIQIENKAKKLVINR